MIYLLCATLGALAFRLRGSELWERWTRTGHTMGCLQWAVAMAAMAYAVTMDEVLLFLVPLFCAGAKPGWYGGINMGRRDGHAGDIDPGEWERDSLIMLARGAVFVAPACAWLHLLDLPWAPLFTAGLLCPLAYEIAWRMPVRGLHARQGPPMGELLFGAVLAAGLVCSVSL